MGCKFVFSFFRQRECLGDDYFYTTLVAYQERWFEREMLLERQREGIARAKAEGKFKGRVPTARVKKAEIQKLITEGMKPTQVAESLGVSRASVYRYLA